MSDHAHVWVTTFGTGPDWQEHCATCGPSVTRLADRPQLHRRGCPLHVHVTQRDPNVIAICTCGGVPVEGAMQDGPNTHVYRDAGFVTEWTVVPLDDPDGVRHFFHVPTVILALEAELALSGRAVPVEGDRERHDLGCRCYPHVSEQVSLTGSGLDAAHAGHLVMDSSTMKPTCLTCRANQEAARAVVDAFTEDGINLPLAIHGPILDRQIAALDALAAALSGESGEPTHDAACPAPNHDGPCDNPRPPVGESGEPTRQHQTVCVECGEVVYHVGESGEPKETERP